MSKCDKCGEYVLPEAYEIQIDKTLQLQAEIEQLEKEKVSLYFKSIDLIDENIKLKEALQKCNPKYNCGCDDGRSCMFCKGLQHKDNCDYVRLTGGHAK